MPLYDYRCEEGHSTEHSRPMADRETPVTCPSCGKDAGVIFSPPEPHNIYTPSNFRAVLGAPTWSDFHDRSERELAKDPNVERFSAVASRSGMGNTMSQPGPELIRKVKDAVGRHPSDSI